MDTDFESYEYILSLAKLNSKRIQLSIANLNAFNSIEKQYCFTVDDIGFFIEFELVLNYIIIFLDPASYHSIRKTIIIFVHVLSCRKKRSCCICTCAPIKKILEHLITCKAYLGCTENFCRDLLLLLNHYLDCDVLYCRICPRRSTQNYPRLKMSKPREGISIYVICNFINEYSIFHF